MLIGSNAFSMGGFGGTKDKCEIRIWTCNPWLACYDASLKEAEPVCAREYLKNCMYPCDIEGQKDHYGMARYWSN